MIEDLKRLLETVSAEAKEEFDANRMKLLGEELFAQESSMAKLYPNEMEAISKVLFDPWHKYGGQISIALTVLRAMPHQVALHWVKKLQHGLMCMVSHLKTLETEIEKRGEEGRLN